jgi:hypothetical protein
MCEVPFSEAPDLFGTVEGPKAYIHCFVKRQPSTPVEVEQMLRAMRYAELECIRYRGVDPSVQQRLFDAGDRRLCDNVADKSIWERLRRWWARRFGDGG